MSNAIPTPTKREIHEDIQQVAATVGDTPTIVQYRVHGTHSINTVRRHFGSWIDGLEAAGFDVPEQQAKPHYRALREAANE